LNFSERDLQKLDDTVTKMAQKGARESLIYMNDMALVVSVANRTVITAMDGSSAKENIFTNIDSAAIL
jgi:flagellar operon protein